MNPSRRLTPEEQFFASQFAAQAGNVPHGLPISPAFNMTHQAAAAALAAAAAAGGSLNPTSLSSHHAHMARAAQMMAANAVAGTRQGPSAHDPHHAARRLAAANHVANLEFGKAFVAAGRGDFQPFLHARPNLATSMNSAVSFNVADSSSNHALAGQQNSQLSNQINESQPTSKRQREVEEKNFSANSASEMEYLSKHLPLLKIPPIGETLPSMDNMQLTNISTTAIAPNDVLCGRGGGTNNHPGNERFRDLVNSQKVIYLHSSKREKPMVSRGIVRAVRNQNPPGRFLQKDDETGLWFDIGDQKAREKTSQALREGAPDIRREITSTLSGGEAPLIPVPSFPNFIGHSATLANDDMGARDSLGARAHHHYHHQLDPNMNPFLFHGKSSSASNQAAPLPMPDALAQLGHFRAAQALAWATQQQESPKDITSDLSQAKEKEEIKMEVNKGEIPEPPCRSALSQSIGGNFGFERLREDSNDLRQPFRGLGNNSSVTCVGSGVDSSISRSNSSPLFSGKNAAGKETEVNCEGASIIADDSQPYSLSADQAHNKISNLYLRPLSYDCLRRLELAEMVAQKTLNGTISDALKAEEYRVSLYMDAGLLNIQPSEIMHCLSQGLTESDVVEEFYQRTPAKRQRIGSFLPPCLPVPYTDKALEALGALTEQGIRDALQDLQQVRGEPLTST